MKIGDVVTLKSGGPKMTILLIRGDLAECFWFIGDEPDSSTFPLAALVST